MSGFLPIENGLGQAARAGVKTKQGPGNLLETGMVGTRLRIKQADQPYAFPHPVLGFLHPSAFEGLDDLGEKGSGYAIGTPDHPFGAGGKPAEDHFVGTEEDVEPTVLEFDTGRQIGQKEIAELDPVEKGNPLACLLHEFDQVGRNPAHARDVIIVVRQVRGATADAGNEVDEGVDAGGLEVGGGKSRNGIGPDFGGMTGQLAS